jgi:murein L,D-transpeptidase YcbB/YkuD
MGEKTFAALEVSIEARLKQIDLNLERERWLPRTNPATRIEVNIPEATLVYYKDNRPTLTMATIVGANSTKTPMFASNVHSIVLNPPWHVPRSISRRERVQPPGPNNALGRVKFDFLNDFSVYLHDTPNHALFAASRRNLSHGCVRLDKPKELAELLLAPQGVDRAKIDEITSHVVTRYIKLQTQTPVALLYRTAYVAKVEPNINKIHFVDDVYEWDNLLENLLVSSKQPRSSRPTPVANDTKIVAAP